MKKLEENVRKELQQIGEKGLTSTNLETTYKLIDILKDIKEVEESEKEMKNGGNDMRYYDDQYRGDYNRGGNYGRGGDYMRNGSYRESYDGRGGMGNRYGHYPELDRFCDKVYRMLDCVEEYYDGRGRYRDGAHQGQMMEGLEKTMYAVCTLVESLMDNADTPEEKEIIRKHIEKMKR